MQKIIDIEIESFPFTVYKCNAYEPPLHKQDDSERVGVILYSESKIVIRENLDHKRLMNTIIHEVTHGMFYATQPVYAERKEFSCEDEFVCEFVALYANKILAISQKIFGAFIEAEQETK